MVTTEQYAGVYLYIVDSTVIIFHHCSLDATQSTNNYSVLVQVLASGIWTSIFWWILTVVLVEFYLDIQSNGNFFTAFIFLPSAILQVWFVDDDIKWLK